MIGLLIVVFVLMMIYLILAVISGNIWSDLMMCFADIEVTDMKVGSMIKIKRDQVWLDRKNNRRYWIDSVTDSVTYRMKEYNSVTHEPSFAVQVCDAPINTINTQEWELEND